MAEKRQVVSVERVPKARDEGDQDLNSFSTGAEPGRSLMPIAFQNAERTFHPGNTSDQSFDEASSRGLSIMRCVDASIDCLRGHGGHRVSADQFLHVANISISDVLRAGARPQ
jgi:hypothetical protein